MISGDPFRATSGQKGVTTRGLPAAHVAKKNRKRVLLPHGLPPVNTLYEYKCKKGFPLGLFDSRTDSVLRMHKMDINTFLHWGVRMKKCMRTRGRKERPVASRECISGVHECPDLQGLRRRFLRRSRLWFSSPESTIAAASSTVCKGWSFVLNPRQTS